MQISRQVKLSKLAYLSIEFGGNQACEILMAATVGVPLYACGGGTIPLLQQWMWEGMSLGSASAFMITGPATKITNLGALKIVMILIRVQAAYGNGGNDENKKVSCMPAYVCCFNFTYI